MVKAHPHYLSGQNNGRKYIIVQHVFSAGKVSADQSDSSNNKRKENGDYNADSTPFHQSYERQNLAWKDNGVNGFNDDHGVDKSIWNDHKGTDQFNNNHVGHDAAWNGRNSNNFEHDHAGNKSIWNGYNVNQFSHNHGTHKLAWSGQNGNDESNRIFTIQHIFRTPLQYAFVTRDLGKLTSRDQGWQKPRLFKKSWTNGGSSNKYSNNKSTLNHGSKNGWGISNHAGNGWSSDHENSWALNNGNNWPSTNGNDWQLDNGNGWPSDKGSSDNSRYSHVNSDHTGASAGYSNSQSKWATSRQDSSLPRATYGWIKLVPHQTQSPKRKLQHHQQHNSNIHPHRNNNVWPQQLNPPANIAGAAALKWTLFPVLPRGHTNKASVHRGKARSGQSWVSGPWNPQDNINPGLAVKWYDDNRLKKPQ